jgi:SAM-dependent methyltransferase
MKINLLVVKLKNRVKREVKRQVVRVLPWAMPQLMPQLMQFAHCIPHRPEANSYVLPAYPAPTDFDPISPLPVPPSDLWVNYGSTAAEYLESGRQDVEKMRQIVEQSGAPIDKAERILEFGCAAGRMIRWLTDLAPTHEIWGVDIWASAILWCKEHLGSLHFATTTIDPHLPFEDRYFDFAYAGSIFTHIEDLTDAWFLELRRILRPGGKLYFSINDRRAVAVFEGQRTEEEFERYYKRTGGKENWNGFVDNWLRSKPEYQRFKNKEVNMVTLNRSMASHILWDAEFLCKRQERFWRVLSINERAYGHQTTVLLERI